MLRFGQILEPHQAMITLTCKSYRARADGENLILEIDGAQPSSSVPKLMSKADVASYFHISVRKVAQMAQSGRLPVVRVDGMVRFREEDVMRLLTENQAPKARLLALPVRSKPEI